MNSLRASALMAIMLLVAACQPTGPLRTIAQGEELAAYDFSEPRTFEEGALPGAVLRIMDGVYRIDVQRGDRELWWGQWGDSLSDVILDVNIEQVTENNENAYGVMCRVRGAVGQAQTPDATLVAIAEGEPSATPAETPVTEAEDATPEAESPTAEATVETTAASEEATSVEQDNAVTADSLANGDGYLFLIQGSGAYGIFRSSGRELTPLVNWSSSDAITRGPGENRLRAVCISDYLALYVNDRLLAQAIDDRYQEGQVGLVASSSFRLGVQVEFDDLTVFTGRITS